MVKGTHTNKDHETIYTELTTQVDNSKYVAWTLVLILSCVLSVLGYREWQHSLADDNLTEHRILILELQDKHLQLSAELAKIEGVTEQAAGQSVANVANLATLLMITKYTNDKLNGLIEKLSILLPGGAYIAPPEPSELKEFNPRIIVPPNLNGNEDDPNPEEQPAPQPNDQAPEEPEEPEVNAVTY